MGVDRKLAPTHHLISSTNSRMEAIKKKMQAMKVEKDNACDRVDVCEEQCKAARLRASKGEDEVDELMTKARQLETELDLTTEKLAIATLQLEEKEKLMADTELEMNALNRRVSGLEEALEITETKMVQAVSKLDKAATASDDSERAKKVFQCKAEEDDKRIAGLEKELKGLETRRRRPMQLTTTLPRSSLSARPTLRRRRNAQMSARRRSLSLRRSCGLLPTT